MDVCFNNFSFNWRALFAGYFVFYVIDNFHAIWAFFAELDDRLNLGFSKTENEGTHADPFPEFKDDNK